VSESKNIMDTKIITDVEEENRVNDIEGKMSEILSLLETYNIYFINLRNFEWLAGTNIWNVRTLYTIEIVDGFPILVEFDFINGEKEILARMIFKDDINIIYCETEYQVTFGRSSSRTSIIDARLIFTQRVGDGEIEARLHGLGLYSNNNLGFHSNNIYKTIADLRHDRTEQLQYTGRFVYERMEVINDSGIREHESYERIRPQVTAYEIIISLTGIGNLHISGDIHPYIDYQRNFFYIANHDNPMFFFSGGASISRGTDSRYYFQGDYLVFHYNFWQGGEEGIGIHFEYKVFFRREENGT